MKLFSPIIFTASACLVLSNSVHALSYFTSFNGYTLGELDGQQGWTSNGATATTGFVSSVAGSPWNGRAGSIGFVDPAIPAVSYVSQSNFTPTPLIGTFPPASFSALFQVQDSDSGFGPGAQDRDSFGFRLQNSVGDNLFSFILTPFSQSPTPESSTNFNTYSWSTGLGAPTTVLTGLAAQENFAYTFTVNFFDAGAGDVGFNANINGIDNFSGTLTGLGSQSISTIGAFWDTNTGAAGPGSNFMLFDNVTLIPEPSSALLGILGTSCLFFRRRRA